MSDRTIGILGLGIFGSSVLTALAQHDINIIAIDDHEERINQFEPVLVRGVVGDITDEELLLSAGIDTCDTVVVATGENLESSVLAVMHCKGLGVPTVIAKVKSYTAKKVLEKIGADSVISPEYEMGRSLAQTILFNNSVDVFQLDKNVSIVEMKIPRSWAGKSLSELDLRGQYNLNILGFRDYENAPLDVQFGPNDQLKADGYMMAVINNQYLDNLAHLND
ncbi:potassium channel family protein [Streptococcus infantis]|uniref:TrkA N-terminal domain protein n=1 Tax=Streptococcus infantis ATCC 700779 TaxID=889204 RepID=E8JXU0_9STRE|nr:TrkA family potassium uptake protein [Streptococcus infantis]EFX37620.1 TrkA N-terminal domain protein [Streptococcus infantis ATCC 700779]EIG39318.1 Trk system potassium uptake protein TrkA, N-terminal domain protein [Streptococcus infantis ATCC 700779]SUN83031.1 Trk family potassium uptake protein [Streptococcus infantis]